MAVNTQSTPPPPSPPLISLTEAAQRVGVAPNTLRRWVAQGLVPARRVGPRLIRIDPADLADLVRVIPAAS